MEGPRPRPVWCKALRLSCSSLSCACESTSKDVEMQTSSRLAGCLERINANVTATSVGREGLEIGSLGILYLQVTCGIPWVCVCGLVKGPVGLLRVTQAALQRFQTLCMCPPQKSLQHDPVTSLRALDIRTEHTQRPPEPARERP